MHKLLTVTILLFLASLAVAQDFPKAEIFGGYQFSRQNSSNLNGWNASLTGNFNHWRDQRFQRRLYNYRWRGFQKLHVYLRANRGRAQQ